ncbi:MAG TPA: hypothetical protein VM939_04830 [Gemmatimonadaceae bacterium]|nr:hypothetical protein [Gemmatimonadaceae bacterium]
MQCIRYGVVALFAITTIGCSTDEVSPTEPASAKSSGRASSSDIDPDAILVSSTSQLVDALTPANAGRIIHVTAGVYNLTAPLNVPDGVTLEGEGVMQFDDAGLPTGFAPGTRTTLRMTANVPGNLLKLNNGVTLRSLAIEDLVGRTGNAVGIMSRSVEDTVHATLDENEIINPNPHVVVLSGGSGCGVYVVTDNPNMGSPPPAHSEAAVSAKITRSLIRSSTAGFGCGVFAFNFAPLSSVSIALAGNVVGGGMIASGGVSRPDAVRDSKTNIQSRRNLYLNEAPNRCAPVRLGWNVQGGAGVPAPLLIGATERNSLRVHSQDDRIEGFTTGVFAAGGRRFFGLPTAGASTDNTADLELIGTTISTPSCAAGILVADFRLAGAIVANASLVPGDGNTVRAVIRSVTGSGVRQNLFADVLGPTGPVAPVFRGTGNRLEIAGSPRAFEQTNTAISPAPANEFFTSDGK